jgi:hypothetical protein
MVCRTPAAATVPVPDTDPGKDPVPGGTGTTTLRTSRPSQGDAPGQSLAEVPRADSLATPTEGATTGVTAEAAAADPEEEVCPEGDLGLGGKHHPPRSRIKISVRGLKSQPNID